MRFANKMNVLRIAKLSSEVSLKAPSGMRFAADPIALQMRDGQIEVSLKPPCSQRFADGRNVLCFTKLGSRTFRCANEFERAGPDILKTSRKGRFLNGRDGQIRTDDILLPKQALYQAELRPVTGRGN